jgi:hypothetical protein
VTLWKTTKYNRIWLDAKGRPCFVVTPIRHVEAFHELSDVELVAFYVDSCLLLRGMFADSSSSTAVESKQQQQQAEKEEDEEAAKDARILFDTMVVNQGNFRNLAHIHLKIRLNPQVFKVLQATSWTAAQRLKYEKICEIMQDKTVFDALIGGAFDKSVRSVKRRLSQDKKEAEEGKATAAAASVPTAATAAATSVTSTSTAASNAAFKAADGASKL